MTPSRNLRRPRRPASLRRRHGEGDLRRWGRRRRLGRHRRLRRRCGGPCRRLHRGLRGRLPGCRRPRRGRRGRRRGRCGAHGDHRDGRGRRVDAEARVDDRPDRRGRRQGLWRAERCDRADDHPGGQRGGRAARRRDGRGEQRLADEEGKDHADQDRRGVTPQLSPPLVVGCAIPLDGFERRRGCRCLRLGCGRRRAGLATRSDAWLAAVRGPRRRQLGVVAHRRRPRRGAPSGRVKGTRIVAGAGVSVGGGS